MDDSWENWLSNLEMSGDGGASSSLSFEEIMSFKGQSCDDSSNNIAEPEQEKTPKRVLGKHGLGEVEARERKGTKKVRSSSGALDHIMSERKRRQEMAEKFIALSAAIPGLKKIDKASILQEAINYVKQLQERIAVLEKESNKKSIKPLIVTKSHLCSVPCEKTNSDDHGDYGANEVLLEVEARWLEKEVLIRIYCEKRRGIMLELLAVLENNHLSVASSSILPFGNSTLNIIIIAQMTEEFNLTVDDLVKNLRQYLLKFMRCNGGPC